MDHGEDGWIDPDDDPDFISEEGNAGPGPIQSGLPSPGWLGGPGPAFVPEQSTPLADESDEGDVPRYAVWSMKYLRGSHPFSHSEMAIRESFGQGSSAVYVMDDGRKHCLISRKVGSGSDGSTYCLVAQIAESSYEQLVEGGSPEDVFAGAKSYSLCSVYEAEVEGAVSNVTVVESYQTVSEVPPDYLPPHPPIEFEPLSLES